MSNVIEYGPAVRAAALAAVAAGGTYSGTARDLGIPRVTVRRWCRQEGLTEPTMADQEKREDLGELTFEYLRSALVALTAQVELFSDSTWLGQQSARDLAILHGVLNDKVVRILAALQMESLTSE